MATDQPAPPASDDDDLSLLMGSVRTAFVERTWYAVTLVCFVALIGIPLRSAILGRPMNSGIAVASAVAIFGLVIFNLRHRLWTWAYEITPTAIVLTGAVIAIFTLGLQGNGITYFIVGNTMVAMLFAQHLVSRTFSLVVCYSSQQRSALSLGLSLFGSQQTMRPIQWCGPTTSQRSSCCVIRS